MILPYNIYWYLSTGKVAGIFQQLQKQVTTRNICPTLGCCRQAADPQATLPEQFSNRKRDEPPRKSH